MLKSLQLCFHLPCTRFKYNSSSVLVFGCQQQATVSWFLVVGHRHNRDGRSIITMNTVYVWYVQYLVWYCTMLLLQTGTERTRTGIIKRNYFSRSWFLRRPPISSPPAPATKTLCLFRSFLIGLAGGREHNITIPIVLSIFPVHREGGCIEFKQSRKQVKVSGTSFIIRLVHTSPPIPIKHEFDINDRSWEGILVASRACGTLQVRLAQIQLEKARSRLTFVGRDRF